MLGISVFKHNRKVILFNAMNKKSERFDINQSLPRLQSSPNWFQELIE